MVLSIFNTREVFLLPSRDSKGAVGLMLVHSLPLKREKIKRGRGRDESDDVGIHFGSVRSLIPRDCCT